MFHIDPATGFYPAMNVNQWKQGGQPALPERRVHEDNVERLLRLLADQIEADLKQGKL